MKALSIKQPWASLIALGIKDIENRTWKTNFRGRIYIHASAKWVENPQVSDTYGFVYNDIQWSYITENYALPLTALLDPKCPFDRLPISAIIGEVDIVDCVINHSSIWAEKSDPELWDNHGNPIYDKPLYNWVLANAVLYDEPILNVKGKLSFWDFQPHQKKTK